MHETHDVNSPELIAWHEVCAATIFKRSAKRQEQVLQLLSDFLKFLYPDEPVSFKTETPGPDRTMVYNRFAAFQYDLPSSESQGLSGFVPDSDDVRVIKAWAGFRQNYLATAQSPENPFAGLHPAYDYYPDGWHQLKYGEDARNQIQYGVADGTSSAELLDRLERHNACIG